MCRSNRCCAFNNVKAYCFAGVINKGCGGCKCIGSNCSDSLIFVKVNLNVLFSIKYVYGVNVCFSCNFSVNKVYAVVRNCNFKCIGRSNFKCSCVTNFIGNVCACIVSNNAVCSACNVCKVVNAVLCFVCVAECNCTLVIIIFGYGSVRNEGNLVKTGKVVTANFGYVAVDCGFNPTLLRELNLNKLAVCRNFKCNGNGAYGCALCGCGKNPFAVNGVGNVNFHFKIFTGNRFKGFFAPPRNCSITCSNQLCRENCFGFNVVNNVWVILGCIVSIIKIVVSRVNTFTGNYNSVLFQRAFGYPK